MDLKKVTCLKIGFSLLAVAAFGLFSSCTLSASLKDLNIKESMIAPVVPTVPASYAAVKVVSSDSHNCALLLGGTVKCWGSNGSGELGQGDTVVRGSGANQMGANLLPVNLGTGKLAKDVGIGNSFSCALLTDNSVKCWGDNSYGQLGQGDYVNRGDLAGSMGDSLLPIALPVGLTVSKMYVRKNNICLILSDTSLRCLGENDYGQLNLGDTTDRGGIPGDVGNGMQAANLGTGRTAVSVSLGDYHACAVLDNAQVKCWGRGDYGRLGYGNTSHLGVSAGTTGDLLAYVDLGTGKTALSLQAGYYSTCALLNDLTTKCWGHNADGELGLGDANDRGDNGGEMGDSLTAINLGAGNIMIGAGGGHFRCGLITGGIVKCLGRNSSGQLGLGDTTQRGAGAGEVWSTAAAVNLGAGRTAQAVATGYDHSCAILDNNKIKCWGGNSLGSLGLGDAATRGGAAGEMGDNLPIVDL